MNIKQILKNLPVVGPMASRIHSLWINRTGSARFGRSLFQGSESYWKNRYESGGNSGDGSYNQLAKFKAEILNAFVSENGITSVIEYGCGDGNQLSFANYPNYIGFDISPKAISMCRERFLHDQTKIFKLMKEYSGETAELTLSLDVVFHLVEDHVFTDYMDRLFDSSTRFVVIYSSDTDVNPEGAPPHVRHRRFSDWIANNKKGWNLVKHIPNKYPYDGDNKSGSFADFYIYSKA